MPSPAVQERLDRLAPDQRAAATAPPGPVLCIAPAGSGKTTTLVARIAWLVDGGTDPGTVTAVTFNKRAAEELTARLQAALPVGSSCAGSSSVGSSSVGSSPVRVRTFHALGLEMLRDAGEAATPLLDRESVLRSVLPEAADAELRRLDTVFSRLKLDLDVAAADVAADPEAGPTARAYVAYEAALAAAGGLDFDDLVARGVHLLERRPDVLADWRRRCTHLLVDEAQDLDRMQLRMALLLAAPANRIFLVGDDDQRTYGWCEADWCGSGVSEILTGHGVGVLLAGLRGVPAPLAIAVPIGQAALRVAFTAGHAGELGHLGLHDRPGQDPDALAQAIGVALGDRLAHGLEHGHSVLGHRCLHPLGSSVLSPTTRG